MVLCSLLHDTSVKSRRINKIKAELSLFCAKHISNGKSNLLPLPGPSYNVVWYEYGIGWRGDGSAHMRGWLHQTRVFLKILTP